MLKLVSEWIFREPIREHIEAKDAYFALTALFLVDAWI